MLGNSTTHVIWLMVQCRLAFAELNTLLQQHQHLLKEVTLRSYHSFTREAKGVVLQRVIAADPAVRRQVTSLCSCAAAGGASAGM